MVTGAVTTPPGSPASLELCGLRVAAQARVYTKHMEDYRIFRAAHAWDLRMQKDPAGIGLLPSGSGQGAGP